MATHEGEAAAVAHVFSDARDGDTVTTMKTRVTSAAESASSTGIHALTPEQILKSLNEVERKHAPRHLFARGDLGLLERGPRVSIVGSRQAASLSRALVAREMIVVSGLAAGIDTAAHTAAIDAGGRTIAVLGTPLEQTYPKENAALQARIAQEHLLVSQFPTGTPVQPKNFPLRNRTMALLTDATVIVEAGESSGTLHQGREALRLGRLLFLLESVVNNPALRWPQEMIHYGAHVLSRENLERCFAELPAVTVGRAVVFAAFA
jgi:DNA processing protein